MTYLLLRALINAGQLFCGLFIGRLCLCDIIIWHFPDFLFYAAVLQTLSSAVLCFSQIHRDEGIRETKACMNK